MRQRARAVVIRGGEVAVIKRIKQGRRYAVLPGGKVEPGETPAQTAVRELAEETCLHTRVDRLLWHDEPNGQSYFLMVPTDGALRLVGPETAHCGPQNQYEPCWARADELAAIDLRPSALHATLVGLLAPDPVTVDVVGLPAAGWSGLGEPERQLVLDAQVVLGGERLLALLPRIPGQRRTRWPRPLRDGLVGLVDDQAGAAVVAVASGDPLTAGVGSTLIEVLGPERVRVHPAVSCTTLARARLGWSQDSVEVVRLVSDTATEVVARLSPGRRLVLLSRDVRSPATVAQLLTAHGFGGSRLTVFGDLGTPTESRRDVRADEGLGRRKIPRLNLVAVECVPDRPSALWSAVPGLPDDAYEHDGQLTKRLQRAAALAHLRPAPGELLWDIGAGAGSVAVEWSRAAARCRAVAVERVPRRAARVAANADRLGAAVQVVTGSAPESLVDLERPDGIFVGGGATAEVLAHCLVALRPGGRLVVHAVTVETESLLVAARLEHGGELTRIGVEQLGSLGRFTGWEPSRTVVQWSLQRPLDDVSAS
ncbi:MAG: precorrin-6y C5,15-methyltransferase (decarboxylating) subunit CbiE [Propionibacteriaceae bacterium]